LRPADEGDCDFIVALRNDPALGRFIQRGATTVDEQQAWMREYYARPGDYLFVVERREGRAEGMVGLYDVKNGEAEWGRWVLRRGSLAAVESALGIYKAGFELLNLDRIYCRTVADNVHVLSFHDSCGLHRTSRQVPRVRIGAQSFEMVEHELAGSRWPSVRARLDKQAARIASRAQCRTSSSIT